MATPEELEAVASIRYWKCAWCGMAASTQRNDVVVQYHNCPAAAQMSTPMVEVSDPDNELVDDKPDGLQRVVNREDGPGVASVRTERGDGSNDCTVFAQTAMAGASAKGF